MMHVQQNIKFEENYLGDNEMCLRSDALGWKSGSIGSNFIPWEHSSKPSGFVKPGEFLDQLTVDRLLTQDLSKPI
jgi:hypothetical protein